MVSISGVIFILASLDGRLDLSDNSDLPCSFSRFIQRYNVERAIPHRRAVFVTEPVSAYSSSHFWRIRIFRISSFMLRRYGLRFAYEKKRCSVSIDTLQYKDVVTITDYARMIFCLNELPRTNDRSDGYFRRFLIVPFKVQIPKSKIDPKLAKTIISSDLPGIMNWVLDGMRRLTRQQGFAESKLCQKELEKYKAGKAKNRNSLILSVGYQR